MFVSSCCRTKGNWSGWSDDLRIPPFSAGLQFGISVFEGMQAHFVRDGQEFRIQFLPDHYQRLLRSASVLGIEVPDMSTFEDGIVRAIERTLGQESDRSRFSQRRIYLRSLHFSGCEDIFPRSDFPFFCNIFARLIPNAAAPVKISILADKPYVRSVLGSHLGSSKCAVNYTRMVELDLLCKHPPAMQRLWVSNSTGFPIEELDTMAIGFMGAGGEFILPPKSAGKLPSITLARLTQKLLEEGQVVRSEAVGLSELREHLASGAIVGIFAVSTGKGLAIAEQIQIGDELLRIVTPNDRIEALWHTFTRIYKEPAGARLPTLQ